ncbi:hypothetical protein [Streptococcus orisasini]|uniref:hypothetical protein n=1 Tax=Streptococcus orisasini TaxID=1080071 RepID=UPI000710D967|nr:hypothetical protein [Streptococcus orisasini]
MIPSKRSVYLSYAYLFSLPIILLVSAVSENTTVKIIIFGIFMAESILVTALCWKDFVKIFKGAVDFMKNK